MHPRMDDAAPRLSMRARLDCHRRRPTLKSKRNQPPPERPLLPSFKDHFSGDSASYGRYRPGYPDTLFAWLSGLVPVRHLAWDCGCGTGQAARGLAPYFKRVEATDPSAAQVAAAAGPHNVHFRVAAAEASGLDDRSVDLIVVAQALHWFDHDPFYAEVRRVLKPGGIVAAFAYALSTTTPETDALMMRLYNDITGPYWPPERRYFDQGYADSLPFPFPRLAAPSFRMEERWTAGDMLGFLRTWSAVKRYEAERGTDPVSLIEAEMRKAWGEGARTVVWPVELMVGEVA